MLQRCTVAFLIFFNVRRLLRTRSISMHTPCIPVFFASWGGFFQNVWNWAVLSSRPGRTPRSTHNRHHLCRALQVSHLLYLIKRNHMQLGVYRQSQHKFGANCANVVRFTTYLYLTYNQSKKVPDKRFKRATKSAALDVLLQHSAIQCGIYIYYKHLNVPNQHVDYSAYSLPRVSRCLQVQRSACQ